MKDAALVIVDMLYDFIDGSLACENAAEAVRKTNDFINEMTSPENDGDENEITGQFPIIFVCDNHPSDHCSFKENGGEWPSHCVKGTHGSAIHDLLRPYASEELTFYKGCDASREEYSGAQAVNKAGQTLSEVLELLDLKNVFLCGIATEFCVRETARDLAADGFSVTLLENALGYVDRNGHERTLSELKSMVSIG